MRIAMTSTASGPLTLSQPSPIPWIVRPATPQDRAAASRVLDASYSLLLKADYDDELLARAVPLMNTPRESLLTCGTWYVVEHPDTKEITGCGGWTAEAPKVSTPNDGNQQQQQQQQQQQGADAQTVVPHLRHFACHPDWKRRGVARAIWDRTWSEISEQIGPNTTLEVYSTKSAVPFYGSLGFVPEKNLDIPLDGKDLLFPAVLMRREMN